MFNPVPTRVEDILNSPSQFAIPLYQREYKWGTDEALELIEDLKSYPGTDDDKLFLGNLIFENTKGQKTFVVDGQQRLTTLMLLLVACRTHAKRLDNSSLATAIQNKIGFMDATTAESLGCRLIASDSIKEVFEHITNGSWNEIFPTLIGKKSVKRQVNRLKPIYDFFLDQITAFNQPELSGFLRSIYNAYVIRIDIEDEIEALKIFERTNARGLDLEVSDLLKNYLFSQKFEGIEELWKQVLDNSDGTVLRMLKYFYVSKRGHVRKPELYKKLKSYGAEKGAQILTEELAEFSRFYQLFRNPTEKQTKDYFECIELFEISRDEHKYQKINAALEALEEFKVAQFCPPAYAAVECLIKGGKNAMAKNAKALIRLYEAFEKYHFVNNVICERVGNEVERLYSESCVAFCKSSDFVTTADKLTADLKSKLAKEDEFVAKFTDINYAQDKLSLICYIFDRFNNHGLDPAQRVIIYNPDPKLRKNHNIEHFLPQKPEPSLKVKPRTLERVDNIGNLLPLYFRTNSRLSNATPAKKIERLKGEMNKEIQNLPYVNDFVTRYGSRAASWDEEAILNRAREMALHAYRTVWKLD